MNQLNSIILEGNVVRQADLSEPAQGFKTCRFPIAVNRWYKNRNGDGIQEVSYFDVAAYGKMAEVCQKQSKKGRGIRVVGRLKQDRWKDSEGKSVSKVFVVAEHIEYRPMPAANSQEEGSPQQEACEEAVCEETDDVELESDSEEVVF